METTVNHHKRRPGREFTIVTSTQPTRNFDYIGQIADTLCDASAYDYAQKLLAEYPTKSVRFIHYEATVSDPGRLYKNLSYSLRSLFKNTRSREHFGGFRLFNIIPRNDGLFRVVVDIAVIDGPMFSLAVFELLEAVFHVNSARPSLAVTLAKPKGTRDLQRQYLSTFRDRSWLLADAVDIQIVEPYFWRVSTAHMNTVSLILAFWEALPREVETIENGYGLSIGRVPLISRSDYASNCRSMLMMRYRMIQPFGKSYCSRRFKGGAL